MENMENYDFFIEVDRIIDRGEKSYKILSLDSKTKDQFPLRYIANNNAVWLNRESKCFEDRYITILEINIVYQEKDFEERMRTVGSAAALLREITKQLREENTGWYGESVFKF